MGASGAPFSNPISSLQPPAQPNYLARTVASPSGVAGIAFGLINRTVTYLVGDLNLPGLFMLDQLHDQMVKLQNGARTGFGLVRLTLDGGDGSTFANYGSALLEAFDPSQTRAASLSMTSSGDPAAGRSAGINADSTLLNNFDATSDGYVWVQDETSTGGGGRVTVGASRTDSATLTVFANAAGSSAITAQATKLGFFAAAAVARPTITGSRSAATVAVLTQVLAALNGLGLVLDSTTP